VIVRSRRSSSYTVINNRIINDEKLDWKELGLLVYLLSKPDSWEVSVTHLAKIRKTKTNGVYSVLKSLRDIGYIAMNKQASGKTNWVVYEKPNQEKPNQEKPNQEKPNQEKPNQEKPNEDLGIQVSTERAVSTEEKVITEKELLSGSESEQKKIICESVHNEDEVAVIEPKRLNKQKTEIVEIFEFWKETLNHGKARFDKKREKVIVSALRCGYSVADLKTAIVGCSKTPHNMGMNDRNEVYDKLSLIFRDGEQIERFMNNADPQPNLRFNKPQLQRGVKDECFTDSYWDAVENA